MKPENELRLARLASLDARRGGAFALLLAERMQRMTGSTEGQDIVSRVYTHPTGQACHECRECGQEYLTASESYDCCAGAEFDYEEEEEPEERDED